MLMKVSSEDPQLILFCCGHCGTLSVRNFRDDDCRVCKTAMQVTMITIGVSSLKAEPAPHLFPGEDDADT